MTARDAILTKIRATRIKGDYSALPQPRPERANVTGDARREAFIKRARAVDAEVTEIASLAEIPGVIAEALRARNLPPVLRIGADPMLDRLADAPGALEITRGPARPDETAALSCAWRGVAETGTLCLLSGPDNPVTLTFLPDRHFALMREADLRGGYEDLWADLRASGHNPRTVNLVTGPSRTADIEQTLTLGAHGPRGLHILLLRD